MRATKQELSPLHRYLDLACMGLLSLSLLITFYYYYQLPEVIPTHFDASGSPDGYGSRKGIWILPAITLFTYLIIKWSLSFTKNSTYETLRKWGSGFRGKSDAEIDELADFSAKQLSYLNLIIVGVLTFLHYINILVALGKAEGLSPYVIWPLLVLIFVPIINLLIFQWKRA